MGIRNARRKSHHPPVSYGKTNEHQNDDLFKPSEHSERQRVRYSPIIGMDGLPTRARIIYVEWRAGQNLQSFFTCMQIDYGHDTSATVLLPNDEDHVETVDHDTRMWQAAEIDCAHGVCHIHPNGHHPPSGKPENTIMIRRLRSVRDVRETRGYATLILKATGSLIVEQHGGDFSERNIIIAVHAITNTTVSILRGTAFIRDQS